MSPSRQSRSWNEHAAILRAIIDGDERLAATLAAEHVMRAGADFMAGLDAIGDEPASATPATAQASKTATSRTPEVRGKAHGEANSHSRPPAPRKAKPEKRSKLA
jgi:hypothetical protein